MISSATNLGNNPDLGTAFTLKASTGVARMEPPRPAIPGYAVLRALGSGQFGDVYLVQRHRDARLFAAKVARVGSAVDAREAQLLQRMRHPNVVGCEEIVQMGAKIAIVMEYAAQGDLEGYLQQFRQRNEKLPEDEVMRLFVQIALALAHLQEQRVLHRDLKPMNVLLDATGVVKLSDFGVSRALQHTLDAAESITGTPSYMSPELMDNQPYDAKTDVWSLGCILYELTTGAPPFRAKALAALVMQIVAQLPPPISEPYSRQLDRLANWLLIKDPAQRPSIHDVLADAFVRRHLFRLASTAPSAPLSNQFASVPDRPLGSSALLPTTDPTPHCEPAQPIVCFTDQVGPPLPPPVASMPSRRDGHGGWDNAECRKMFFENQAAALRNKDKVAAEKAGPVAFADQRTGERPRQVRAPPKPSTVGDIESVREQTKQFYLENARAAKLNKQRAIEAMKGQAEAILRASSDQGASAIDEVGDLAIPPPAPPRNAAVYESLLEKERRRVRLERKLLQERMRQLQPSPQETTPQPSET